MIDPIDYFQGLTGVKCKIWEEDGVKYYESEFWTSKQRQSHSLQEVSYRACFKPELPRFFIHLLSSPYDVVYDPFMGRGTTLIEAAFAKRMPVGNDINPLSKMMVWPRLETPECHEVFSRLHNIDWNVDCDPDLKREDLLQFYHPETLKEICRFRRFFLHNLSSDHIDRWIRMVCISRLTGHSNGFFSVRTMPPNQAVSAKTQKKLNEKNGTVPEPREIRSLIMKKTRSLLKDGSLWLSHPYEFLHTFDAQWSGPMQKVDLVVTSPPFLDVVDYAGDNWLRNWFAGIDEKVDYAQCKTVEEWTTMIHNVLKTLEFSLVRGGHIAMEVGEVRKGTVRLEKAVLKAAEGLNYEPVCVVINRQNFTKTANCWGVDNNSKGTNTNRIVILRKV